LDNEFEFQGKLNNSPSAIILRTVDQVAYLWLENARMTFDASQSDFHHANFKGSKIHEWAEEKLFSKIDTISGNHLTREENSKVRELCLEFVERYPENLISAHILSIYSGASEVSLERKKYLYDNLSLKNKQNTYGQRIFKAIKTLETIDPSKFAPQIGDNFVDFEMMDSSGKMIYLSNNLGDVTLLEFWASWCGPCLAEMPNLKKTYDNYKSSGFEIFAVSLDKSEERWKNKIIEFDLNWTHVSDLNGFINMASMQYNVGAIPDNFLIDSNGEIIARNLRGEELNSELNRLLK
jgi:peroxiredoxin